MATSRWSTMRNHLKCIESDDELNKLNEERKKKLTEEQAEIEKFTAMSTGNVLTVPSVPPRAPPAIATTNSGAIPMTPSTNTHPVTNTMTQPLFDPRNRFHKTFRRRYSEKAPQIQ